MKMDCVEIMESRYAYLQIVHIMVEMEYKI